MPAASLLPLVLSAPALAAAAASGPPSFEAYARRFGLGYSEAELPQRRKLYEQRIEAIAAQNAKADRLWTAGVNHLTAATEAEIAASFGYNKALRGDAGAGAAAAPARRPLLRASRAQPRSLDWREHRPSVVTAVKSQGGCGSCWAFSAAAVMESHIALETGVLFDLSPQQLTSCTPNPESCGGAGGCVGATPQLAWNYTIQVGISSQWDYPYLSGFTGESEECKSEFNYGFRVAGITGYVQLPRNDAKALLEGVLQGPVAVMVAARRWALYGGGIFDGCDKAKPILNHAVVLMGYGEEEVKSHGLVHYWLIRNSWGATWGEKGYIRLRRYPQGEPCGLDDEPLLGYSCATNAPANVTACGECGVISDSAYPIGGFLGAPSAPQDPALR